MLRVSGWSTLGAKIEREVTNTFRGHARLMYEAIADRDNDSKVAGSPIASGHYSANVRVGMNRADLTIGPRDRSYNYPSPRRHKYSRYNLPQATIQAPPRTVVTSWFAPFKLGDRVHISNATAYAVVIENGRQGKKGSWQKPRGVFKSTVDELIRQMGW